MTPEIFKQVEQLYLTVLALEPAQRAARLAEVPDTQLRREVEGLLAAHEEAGTFLQAPAAPPPELLATAPQPELSGRILGRYRIHSLLGRGGMGEVYLAEDVQLERQVALKLLPAAFTNDTERVRRFSREAKAVSALNHPNIVTIHEIGQEQDTHYIATEYIDGATLRQRFVGISLPLRTALDIAIQTASALVAAHEAGIIHRDIKPENVMLRRDGIVKVLDFGLAKATGASGKGISGEAGESPAHPLSPASPLSTLPGLVMGTPQYMSPEQARGRKLDARTDIFSLGIVLYEMIAGRLPFAGENVVDVIGAILHQEPAPLGTSDAPAELQRIVSKTLRKDREERYQLMRELLLDLKSLQQEIEFDAKLKGLHVSSKAAAAMAAMTTTKEVEVATTEGFALTRKSSAEYLAIKRRRTQIVKAALLVVLLLLGYSLYRFIRPQPATAHFQKFEFKRQTAVVKAGRGASISPDGKLIVYTMVEGAQQSLWTKVLATNSLVNLVPPSEVSQLGNTTFSHNGNYVYYQVQEKDGQTALYQIPALGGTARRVLTNIRGPIAISPDDGQFAYVRKAPDTGKDQLITVNSDGSNERVLAGNTNQFRLEIWPSWSPDGKLIALGAYLGDSTSATVIGVAVGSGAVKSLTEQKWARVSRVAWFGDGSGLALSAGELNPEESQIFQLSYPSGEVRRITNDLVDYGNSTVSLTADARALLVVQGNRYTNIWIGPLEAAHRAPPSYQKLNLEGADYNDTIWTPDGRIVYVSEASGNRDLWMVNGDGSNRRPLTDAPAADESPVVSPDGRYIVFTSTSTGKLNLWRIDLDGSNRKQLTTGEHEKAPAFSSDGREVIYEALHGGLPQLWKVSIEGGNPTQLTDGPARLPAVSPDGKLIAFMYEDGKANGQRKIAIIPFAGGAPVQTLPYKPHPVCFDLRWMPDSRALIYVHNGDRQAGTNLWRLPLDGSPPQPLTDFKDDQQIWAFDVTRDGKQFVVARGTATTDVVLISEVK